MQNNEVAITTADNPYNPFTELESWRTYDIQMGYFTCERLASLVHNLPDSLSDDENNYFVESAIDELIQDGVYNKFGQFVEYIKVRRKSNEETENK